MPPIPRHLQPVLTARAARWPIVTLTGPRQSGKTTLCRASFPAKPYVSLELPDVRDHALHDPRGLLRGLPDGAILDEVQRAPALLSYLQVDVDERPQPGRWILTGSHNLLLMQSVAQSLAGRTALLQLLPLSLPELSDVGLLARYWTEAAQLGGWPAPRDRGIPIGEWLAAYIASYVERDVRDVLRITDAALFQRFLRLCAGRAGQILNLAALAADAGISHGTATAWLSALETSYIAFRLQPWHANLVSREVKAPKLMFWDTALACALLGIRSPDELALHTARGSLFENLVAVEACKRAINRGEAAPWHHWRDSNGREVDLVCPDSHGNVTALEAKSGETWTPEWARAVEQMGAELAAKGRTLRGAVVYGGDEPRLAGGGAHTVDAVPWHGLAAWLGAGQPSPTAPPPR